MLACLLYISLSSGGLLARALSRCQISSCVVRYLLLWRCLNALSCCPAGLGSTYRATRRGELCFDGANPPLFDKCAYRAAVRFVFDVISLPLALSNDLQLVAPRAERVLLCMKFLRSLLTFQAEPSYPAQFVSDIKWLVLSAKLLDPICSNRFGRLILRATRNH